MASAELQASLSRAERKQVGAVLVTTHGVIVPGWNGTAVGEDNACEHIVDGELVTKPGVIHAEMNTILKCAKEGVSTLGATVYVTLSPCALCLGLLANAGVERIVYKERYRLFSHLVDYAGPVLIEQLEDVGC